MWRYPCRDSKNRNRHNRIHLSVAYQFCRAVRTGTADGRDLICNWPARVSPNTTGPIWQWVVWKKQRKKRFLFCIVWQCRSAPPVRHSCCNLRVYHSHRVWPSRLGCKPRTENHTQKDAELDRICKYIHVKSNWISISLTTFNKYHCKQNRPTQFEGVVFPIKERVTLIIQSSQRHPKKGKKKIKKKKKNSKHVFQIPTQP